MTLICALVVGCGPEPTPAAASLKPAPREAIDAPPPPAALEHPPLSDTTLADATPTDEAIDDPDSGESTSSGGTEATGSAPPSTSDPMRGEVDAGDSLSRILDRAGLSAADIHRVSTAMTPLMDPTTIREGQHYEIEVDDAGALVAFSFRRAGTQVVRVTSQSDGTLTAELEEIETEVREEEIGGTVNSSLWTALTSRGHSASLVDVIVETFAYDIDFFTATRKGDRFRIVVERHEIDGELVHYGRVLAAEYVGASETFAVLWWDPAGKGAGRYVNGEGLGVSRTLLKTPLKYARISSGFDPKRMHPVLHREKSHNGVDYAAPEGTPIWAAADGKLVHRKLAGGAGNMVILRHDGGLKTLYMHMSKFADGQKVGDTIKAKTVIGYVGSTGLATGAHLHFGVQKNGKYVDPTSIESVRGNGVAKSDRKRFDKYLDEWTQRLATIAVQ